MKKWSRASIYLFAFVNVCIMSSFCSGIFRKYDLFIQLVLTVRNLLKELLLLERNGERCMSVSYL